ncbi:unnamed protein product [Peniophora sp. CBMAI 1063]|nr:unnamed protein product [Peniophora sp. CBMAI 1063]
MSEAILRAELAVAKAQLALAQAQEATRVQDANTVNKGAADKATPGGSVAADKEADAAGALLVPDVMGSDRTASDKEDSSSTAVCEEASKNVISAEIVKGDATNYGNDGAHTETWAKLIEEPFRNDAGDAAGLDVDISSDVEVDMQPNVDSLRVAHELAEASEDDHPAELSDQRASELTAKKGRSSARAARAATQAVLAEENNAETAESVTSTPKRKRSATDGRSSDGEDEEDEDLDAGPGVFIVALNKGAAPKGPIFEFADSVMRFAAFAFAYASLWGNEHHALVISMIKPLVQLELAHRFELGHEMPGLPPSAVSWITHRRAACKIDDPSYVRGALKEAHLEHKMLSCMSTLRSLTFADVALMHGRRGYILLVRGMLQARASNILGEDWAMCVGEVARLLAALVQANDGEDMKFSVRDPVLTALTTIDHKATTAVTAILSKRANELKEMNAARLRSSSSSPRPSKRARRSASASPTKAPRSSTGSKSRPQGTKKTRGVEEGSSKGSSQK